MPSPKCKHGRRRNQCKDCGGGSICQHGRRRNQCKDCGGSGICQHGRVRSRCKDCGGSGICQHGRRRGRCKDCGGSGICQHGRIRSTCKDCGGSGICQHGRRRSACKDCGGSGICQHGQIRSRCKDCGEDEEKMETPSRPPKRARVSRTTPPAALATASAALPAFTPNTAGAYQPRLPSPHPPRRGPPAAFAATSLDFQVGESLEVEWNGTHYAAVVLSTTFDGHLNVKYESDQSKESGVEPVRGARGE